MVLSYHILRPVVTLFRHRIPGNFSVAEEFFRNVTGIVTIGCYDTLVKE